MTAGEPGAHPTHARDYAFFGAWALVGAVAAVGYLSAARDGGGVPLPFLVAAALLAYFLGRFERDRRPAWGLVTGAGLPLIVAAFLDGATNGILVALGLLLVAGGLEGYRRHRRRAA